MKSINGINPDEESRLAEEYINPLPEPSHSDAGSTRDIPKYYSPYSISEFMQINCSFVDVDPAVISQLIYSINSKDAYQYKAAMHVFLENCIHKSLKYLSLLKVEPLTSSDKIDFDPSPNRDEYIIRNEGEYEHLQYMCDYFKYCISENPVEVVSPKDEFIINCHEESDCAKRVNKIKRKTNPNKCYRLEAKHGPTVDAPLGTDWRVLYTRNGYALKLLLEKLMQSKITDDQRLLTNANLISKFMIAESEKKIINSSNGMIKKTKASNNTYIANNNWYSNSFVKYHLLLNDRFEKTTNAKKSIIDDNVDINNIIETRKELRNAELKTRDMCIRSFMRYYLSLKDKFEYIYRSRFKDESGILNKEFELPVPKNFSFSKQRVISDSHRCKVDRDIEIVRNRMNRYLLKLKNIGEGETIYGENRLCNHLIKFEKAEEYNVRSDTNLHSTTLNKKPEIRRDTSINLQTFSAGANRNKALRSFNIISGLNISSSITQTDPELADHESIADIVYSLDSNDVSGYLSAMNTFTAKFMHKSLQYVRALTVGLPDYNTTYSTNPNMDEYIVQGNGKYEHLQYICDYFKYYVLESQLESLAYEEAHTKKEILPLLDAINDEEVKSRLTVDVEYVAEEISLLVDEYEELIRSIKRECLSLMNTRKKLIMNINENKFNIASLIRPLDCSTRDALIKCLMEYYLLITDEFESVANLKFKNKSRNINERLILPVPKAIAEVVHEEIDTQQTFHTYYVRSRESFFCDVNSCLCHDPSVLDTYVMIRTSIMENVIDRMKRYLLSHLSKVVH
ncbi:hypothetical protein [Candidatus Ichthyocystis hellenicum]|uniref:hypothetical protein n=1 Tax=Candidatus Ichthyocystis hellenicum TaxID=1561003 RepID=UPI000B807358|nr:hypothetical protein [Candidatus Ichthyocystis hellenicum]